MKKLLSLLGLTFMMAFTLTGCELYFGKKDGGGGGGGGDRQPGWSCTADAECAAGCYCDMATGAQEGECAEAGFCSEDADCPEGYVCDDRSSCVPGDPPQTCTDNSECPAGSFCNVDGVCEASCVCTSDAEAQAAGWPWCDEQRMACMPPTDTTCGGDATCGTKPTCAQGSVPATDNSGCYTGACVGIGACDMTPACTRFQHEADCLWPGDDQNCSASYTGINCKKPDGSACQSGDTGCVCESFRFATCQ